MSTAISYPHIRHDSNGVAWITETQVKVIEIVADWLAHGSSPEEMHFQFPHLSLSQIHSALAYYYDHRPTLEAELAQRTNRADELRATAANQPARRDLLARR